WPSSRGAKNVRRSGRYLATDLDAVVDSAPHRPAGRGRGGPNLPTAAMPTIVLRSALRLISTGMYFFTSASVASSPFRTTVAPAATGSTIFSFGPGYTASTRVAGS